APGWAPRCRQEAGRLASINHPNIATVHSLESEGPVTFITRELIPGNYGRGTPYPLDRRIGSGRGPEPGSRAREQEDAPRLRQLRASVEPGRCARGKIDARLSRSIHIGDKPRTFGTGRRGRVLVGAIADSPREGVVP